MPQALAYFRGDYVPLAEANVNITTHALHYGTAVFEGIRGNWNEEQGFKNSKEYKVFIFRMMSRHPRVGDTAGVINASMISGLMSSSCPPAATAPYILAIAAAIKNRDPPSPGYSHPCRSPAASPGAPEADGPLSLLFPIAQTRANNWIQTHQGRTVLWNGRGQWLSHSHPFGC